jgi:hypothetical protein
MPIAQATHRWAIAPMPASRLQLVRKSLVLRFVSSLPPGLTLNITYARVTLAHRKTRFQVSFGFRTGVLTQRYGQDRI